jgi:hypothetical protein
VEESTAAFTPHSKPKAFGPQTDFLTELQNLSQSRVKANCETPFESLIKTVEEQEHHKEKTSLLLDAQLNNNEPVQDRFIPLRMKENLQAKFEAVSQNFCDLLSQKQTPVQT